MDLPIDCKHVNQLELYLAVQAIEAVTLDENIAAFIDFGIAGGAKNRYGKTSGFAVIFAKYIRKGPAQVFVVERKEAQIAAHDG